MAYLIYQQNVPWTPTIVGTSSAGTGTYSLQAGFYTRIGNMILLTADITWSAHSGTVNMQIGNLPFVCLNQANYNPEGIVNTINIPLPGGGNRTALGTIFSNTSLVPMIVTINNSTNSAVAMNASGELHLTINYLANS